MADATLEVDAKLNNFITPALKPLLGSLVTQANLVNTSLNSLSVSTTKAASGFTAFSSSVARTNVVMQGSASSAKTASAGLSALETKNNALLLSSNNSGLGLANYSNALGKAGKIAQGASMALGSTSQSLGSIGPIASAATSAMSLFAAGMGPVGLAIAGGVIALSLLSEAFSKSDAAAAASSEASLKIAKKNEERILASKDKVISAQREAIKAALESGPGDNTIALLKENQRQSLELFKGTEGQKARIIEANERTIAATQFKLNRDHNKRIHAATLPFYTELADAQINAEQVGMEKELTLERIHSRKKIEEAINAGISKAEAESVIGETYLLKSQEIQKRYALMALETSHSVNIARIENLETSAERERALLDENYHYSLEVATKKGEETFAITSIYEEKEKNLKKKERLDSANESINIVQQSKNILSSLNELEVTQVKNRAKREIEAIDQKEKRGVLSKAQAQKAREQLDAQSTRQQKTLAEQAKVYAYGQAVINIAQGVTKAYGQGGTLGFITGALVAAAGAVELAKINAQEFALGGFPSLSGQGGTLIRVNEGNRQEAVLNSRATRSLGRDAINELNRTGNISNSSSMNYAPNITVMVQGMDPREIISALQDQRNEFFKFMEETKRRGFQNG